MISRIELDNLIAYERTRGIQGPGEGAYPWAVTPFANRHKSAAGARLGERRLYESHQSAHSTRNRHQFRSKVGTTREREIRIADSKLLQKLAIGTSVEFTSGRETRRVLHLKSVSGQGGVYFFREQHTEDATLCLTAVRLSQYLHEGFARILGC